MTNNPTLFDLHAESAFEAYHRDNPAVYRSFVRFTMEAIRKGRTHVGSKAVMERIRWETYVAAVNSSFKVNNNFTPFYARMFERDYPQHKGLFEFRKSKADEIVTI